MHNDTITCIPGIRVGHATDPVARTGCTVVLCEDGMVTGVDVRGSAPGTREIAALNPLGLVQESHAILLTGGSAFGLDAAAGVMRYLEERGRGYPVGPTLRVPIVPGAVIFDLGVGNPYTRPSAEMGYRACQSATDKAVAQGQVGAGTGATVGTTTGAPGGIGSAVEYLDDGLIVAAMVVVNAFGAVYDPNTGTMIAGEADKPFGDASASPFENTTIGVVGTNASLDRVGATKVAQMAHDGLARVIRPIHTMFDGDTIFALAAGSHASDTNSVGILAADAMATSVLRAVQRETHAE